MRRSGSRRERDAENPLKWGGKKKKSYPSTYQYEEGSEWGDGLPLPSLLQSRRVKSLLLNIPDLCFVRVKKRREKEERERANGKLEKKQSIKMHRASVSGGLLDAERERERHTHTHRDREGSKQK